MKTDEKITLWSERISEFHSSGQSYRASGISGKYPRYSARLSTVIMTKGKQPPGGRNCINLVQWTH